MLLDLLYFKFLTPPDTVTFTWGTRRRTNQKNTRGCLLLDHMCGMPEGRQVMMPRTKTDKMVSRIPPGQNGQLWVSDEQLHQASWEEKVYYLIGDSCTGQTMKETASKGTSPGAWETWQQGHIQTLQQQLLLQGECLIRNQTQESILLPNPRPSQDIGHRFFWSSSCSHWTQ